jgi:phosphoglycerate dehydrogenase-like enzyme
MADWHTLGPDCQPRFFHDHVVRVDGSRARLAPFEIIVAMRERTPFRVSLVERLPSLRLLVTTGCAMHRSISKALRAGHYRMRNARADAYPTAELAWGLILSLARRIWIEDAELRAGRWQTTLGIGLNGKTLGVIGLGTLGSRVALFGKAFEMEGARLESKPDGRPRGRGRVQHWSARRICFAARTSSVCIWY